MVTWPPLAEVEELLEHAEAASPRAATAATPAATLGLGVGFFAGFAQTFHRAFAQAVTGIGFVPLDQLATIRAANTRHGGYSAESQAAGRRVDVFIAETRALLSTIPK